MARWLGAALLLASAGCSEGGSVADPCGDDSFWLPGGAGETDDFLGHSRTYANGHSLDWHETDPAVLADELALIDLINAHRANLGLDALQFDRILTRCARGHSVHHYEHNLFQSHVNPEGDDYTGRMSMNGLDFESSGENNAYGLVEPQSVFDAWLNSAEDRANLERSCFIRIGVGKHQSVWTANFAR